MHLSVRDMMLEQCGFADPFEGLEALGLESLELRARVEDGAIGTLTGPDGGPLLAGSEEDVRRLGEMLQEAGAEVCAFLMANDFSSEDLQGQVRALVRVGRAAEALGVPVVRVDLVRGRQDIEEEEFVERCLGALRRALDETSEVELGIENHGRSTNRPQFLDHILEGLPEGRVGVTLDTGNFYWFGHPLEQVHGLLEKYAPRTRHTHIKNISYPEQIRNERREVGYRYGEMRCPIPDGDVDHARVVEALRKAGYRRSLCIEDESLGKLPEAERLFVLQRDTQYLRSLL